MLVISENIERGSEAWVERLIYVLAGARISARMVPGIVLQDRVANQPLLPWLEIHNGKRWEGFDPLTGNKGYPEDFVRWSVGSKPLLEIENGRKSHVSFSITSYAQSLTKVARDRAEAGHSWVSSLLLYNLPVGTQNVYRILLMVPLGALVVAFMRTIVGVPTLGTFMPILVAIAFRETELAWGISLLVLITAAGLTLRFYLERLQLLLVPRLASVLVLELSVIAEFMDAFSIIDHTDQTWINAGRLSHELRRRGKNINLTDCYIAVIAQENNCGIFTLDRHFKEIRQYAGVQLIDAETPMR